MNLQSLILSNFRRVNDKSAPDLLQPDEAVQLQDVVLDHKLGKPVKRGDFQYYDTPVTAGADILKLTDVKDDSNQQNILAAVGTALRSYDPSTNSWSDYITSLHNGFKFRKVPFADKFIFTFDTDDEPIMGSNNLSDYWNLELLAPSNSQIGAIQSFHDSGGNLTELAQYKWVIVGVTEDGQYGPPSRPFTHYVDNLRIRTTDDDTLSTKIYFKNLPYIADDRITSRLLFRTKADDDQVGPTGFKLGNVFYLVAILDNDSAGSEYQSEYEDSIADSDLNTEIAIYLNMPSRAKHIAFSNERLFLGNFSKINKMFFPPPSTNNNMDGTHTGAGNAAALTDSTKSWTVDEWVGYIIHNETDGSTGTITANTSDTITATLSGGTEDDWDVGDVYTIAADADWLGGYGLGHNDDNSGTLLHNTQYDYRIHYKDKYGNKSYYYDEISITTDDDASDDHRLTIKGLGLFGQSALDLYSGVQIYRRTAGAGSYYLIMDVSISQETTYLSLGSSSYYTTSGVFVDGGLPDLTATWSDPDTDVTAYGSAIAFSDVSAPSTFREENTRQIFQDDKDDITGIIDDQEGLIIFKTNTINKVFLTGNWRLAQLVRNYGCDQSETLQKSGSSYYFIYKNKAYRYDYGAEKPIDIGIFFQGTLDTIVSWYDSTINDNYYILQCKDATTYYTLVYDIRLDTWYKWKRTQTASEDFKTIYYTKYGSTQELLSNCDSYITKYNALYSGSSATRADTETGTTVQITPYVKTKDFKFPDGITKARLRKLKFDYYKVTSQDTTILITDADTGTTITLTDNTSNGKKLYESDIGRDTDTLKKTRCFNIRVSGIGFLEWDNLRLEYRSIKEGKAVSV